MLAVAPHLDLSKEHAQDVLAAAIRMAERGQRIALAIVTTTKGGAVRAPGALMAISEQGDAAGYVSGGCIDADVIAQAQAAIGASEMRRLHYGAGSPFVDLRLPCGGSIEILVVPKPDIVVLRAALSDLQSRRSVRLTVSASGGVQLNQIGHTENGWGRERYIWQIAPKLRLRIAGRGAELAALVRVAAACNLPICIQSPDTQSVLNGFDYPDLTRVTLQTPSDVPDNEDDQWTAFVLMFHDVDWETALLADALSGPAFFVGAVGSRATQARRREQLVDAGVATADIDRIQGPIGLVPSLRDASLLAVSALAQVINVHRRTFAS